MTTSGDARDAAPGDLAAGDVVVVSQKVVSKAEGRSCGWRTSRRLRARDGARGDAGQGPAGRRGGPRRDRGRRAGGAGRADLRTHHGFVCANAGVDASNAPGDDALVLLPVDPDGSARALRARLARAARRGAAVVIADSFGRAWRRGQCDVAIGCAGLLRSTTGPAASTTRAASCARRRSRWPTRPRPRRTWPARRTRASPRSSSAAWTATSRRTTAPARSRARPRPRRGPVPLEPERLAHLGRDELRAAGHVPVGEAQDRPAGELHGVGLGAVGLEGVWGGMGRPRVDLDDEPRRPARRSRGVCRPPGPAPAASGCRGADTAGGTRPRAWTAWG